MSQIQSNEEVKPVNEEAKEEVKEKATRVVYSDDERNRDITVTSLGDYREVSIQIREKKDEVEYKEGKSLLVLMPDVSGSMFNDDTITHLITEFDKISRKYLDAGYEVVYLPWASESSYWYMTKDNVAAVLRDSVDEDLINRRINSRINGPNEFQTGKWYFNTLPRLGFERLQQVIREQKDISNVTIVFATDGAFSVSRDKFKVPEGTELTDAFLRDLGQFAINLQKPINMVYLGIKADHVPDAQRIITVFPNTRYYFAASKTDIKNHTTSICNGIEEQVATDSVFLTIDGVSRFATIGELFNCRAQTVDVKGGTAGPVQDIANSEFVEVRKRIYEAYQVLEQVKDNYFKGVNILQALVQVDKTLTGILNTRIAKLKSNGSERNRTRQYLYSVNRYKNQLQQYAAKQSHADDLKNARLVLSKQQDLVMVLQDRYSVTIAKLITRNRERKRDYSVTFSNTQNAETKAYSFTATVVFGDNQQTNVYTMDNVPVEIAENQEYDLLTSETQQEIYQQGDTMGQTFLMTKAHETCIHAPSKIQLKPAMTQLSVSSYYDSVEYRVESDSFQSLFDSPFTGASSEDKYNLVLPTWAPNLNYICRYKLKPILGYLIAGHEQAYPSRAVDIYIPACIGLWHQYHTTRTTKALNDAMLLTLAFIKIKTWTKLGNLNESKAITPARNIAEFLGGNSGSHSFMSLSEPVLYRLYEDLSEEDSKKFDKTLLAEQIYKVAHRHGAGLYQNFVVPFAKDIMHQANLLDAPDFTETPIWSTNDNIEKRMEQFFQTYKVGHYANLIVADVLKAADWKYVEDNFRIADDLNPRLLAAVDAAGPQSLDARVVVPLITVANECPSNSTRREMRKSADDVFRDKLKLIVAENLEGERKKLFYQRRFQTINNTHAGLPLIFDSKALELVNRIRHIDLDDFRDRFKKHFAAQLAWETTQFPMDEKEYYQQVDENLEKLWNDRAGLSTVDTTCTSLPAKRCGHVLCPQFLRYDRSIEQTHWNAMGTDRPLRDETRTWAPNMHMRMSERISLKKQAFIDGMWQYAQMYVHEKFETKFRDYYAWHHNQFASKC